MRDHTDVVVPPSLHEVILVSSAIRRPLRGRRRMAETTA